MSPYSVLYEWSFHLQAWFDDEKADQAKLPGEFEKSLNAFERLILLRAMRPDRVSTALAKWIGEVRVTEARPSLLEWE